MPKKGTSASGTELVLIILEILAGRGEVGVRELARELNMAPSTALRFLRTLVHSGFAVFDEKDKLYRPGLRFLQLGAKVQERFTLSRIARPVLEDLFARAQETVNLGILSSDLREVIHMDKIVTDRVVRIDTGVGRTAPAYCTALGKAMLSFQPLEQVAAYLAQAELVPRTPNTLVSPEALLADLERCRARGYAIDQEEYAEHLECVAAPVFGYRGQVVAGISISRLAVPGKEPVSELAPEVVRSGQELSSQLATVPDVALWTAASV